MRHTTRTNIIITIIILLLTVGTNTTTACKDIVAVHNATQGDYNYLLKVRDPSRPGLQILTIIPNGTTYKYPHPRTGQPLTFTVKHSYIAVTSQNDTLPNIIKAGMVLSSTGIAYGDADTNSNWINRRRYAWDDFDWLRYAYEQADTEDEAVTLLTKDCVDELHATGVSENLFVVGPQKAYIIEADAYRYNIKEINDLFAISNYPKALWQSQLWKKRPIAKSFDTVKTQLVRPKQTIRLQSLFAIRITDINQNSITAKQTPPIKIQHQQLKFVGKKITIPLGERKTVGDYSITLHDIQNRQALITVEYVHHAWEQTILSHLHPYHGSITLQHLINISRLHRDELNHLRGMCEPTYPYEAVIIYKIPTNPANHSLTSCWFAANHACSSIYVPIHIDATHIYTPYTTGTAAQLNLNLVETWGHKTLIPLCYACEHVLIHENTLHEHLLTTNNITTTPAHYFTTLDTQLQKQAFTTQQLWYTLGIETNPSIKNTLQPLLPTLWNNSYIHTLPAMLTTLQKLTTIPDTKTYQNLLTTIINSIIITRWNLTQHFYPTNITNNYPKLPLLNQQITSLPTQTTTITQFLNWTEHLLIQHTPPISKINEKEPDPYQLTTLNLLLLIILLMTILFLIIKHQNILK